MATKTRQAQVSAIPDNLYEDTSASDSDLPVDCLHGHNPDVRDFLVEEVRQHLKGGYDSLRDLPQPVLYSNDHETVSVVWHSEQDGKIVAVDVETDGRQGSQLDWQGRVELRGRLPLETTPKHAVGEVESILDALRVSHRCDSMFFEFNGDIGSYGDNVWPSIREILKCARSGGGQSGETERSEMAFDVQKLETLQQKLADEFSRSRYRKGRNRDVRSEWRHRGEAKRKRNLGRPDDTERAFKLVFWFMTVTGGVMVWIGLLTSSHTEPVR